MRESYQLIIDSSERSSDLLYLAGFDAPDDFLYFAGGGECGILVSELERDRARREAKPGVTVYGADDFPGAKGVSPAKQALALAADRRIRKFQVPGNFPLRIADRLRREGLTVTPEDGAFAPEREWKNTYEVQEITRAIRIAEQGVRRAFEALREAAVADNGTLFYRDATLTSERLRQLIDLELAAHGAMPTGTIVAGGGQGAEPHNPGSGPLHAGSPIVMDVFPRLRDSRYWGDLTRTVCKGTPPVPVESAYRAVKAARDHCKTLLKPGAVPARVHEEAVKIMNDAGFRTGRNDDRSFGFFHSLGHGLGLDIHESPRLGPRNETPLKGGEVVTVEPGLYYAEWGGIRLEDVMHITADGAVCLTEIEDFLVID